MSKDVRNAESEVKELPDDGAAYNVILLMRHPDIDPGEVTREFGLTPHVAFRKGCVRTLQNGKELPGVSRDSRWNHVYRFSMGRRVGEALAQIVTFLEGHKAFIKKLCLHGASFELYVQLPGTTNIGDSISWDLLRRMSQLRVSLGIEVFPRLGGSWNSSGVSQVDDL